MLLMSYNSRYYIVSLNWVYNFSIHAGAVCYLYFFVKVTRFILKYHNKFFESSISVNHGCG